MQNQPFSVLMSVYKDERSVYLDDCFKSITSQTLPPNEIVLVEDGPLNEDLKSTITYWKKILQDNLVSVSLLENQGLAYALNEGLKKCSHEWIARMDTDDVMVPTRFEKQLGFLKNNPQIDVLGSFIEEYDEELNKSIGLKIVPITQKDIIAFSKYRNPMNHMSVVFRRSAVQDEGGYPTNLRKNQDYLLWVKMLIKGYQFANLTEPLVKVRTGKEFLIKRQGMKYFRYEWPIFTYMRDEGFINSFEFYRSMVTRLFVRMMPISISRIIYLLMRNQKESIKMESYHE